MFGGALCITAHTATREDLILFLIPFLISLCTTACATMAVVIGRNNQTLVNSVAASLLLQHLAEDSVSERPALRVVDQG